MDIALLWGQTGQDSLNFAYEQLQYFGGKEEQISSAAKNEYTCYKEKLLK